MKKSISILLAILLVWGSIITQLSMSASAGVLPAPTSANLIPNGNFETAVSGSRYADNASTTASNYNTIWWRASYGTETIGDFIKVDGSSNHYLEMWSNAHAGIGSLKANTVYRFSFKAKTDLDTKLNVSFSGITGYGASYAATDITTASLFDSTYAGNSASKPITLSPLGTDITTNTVGTTVWQLGQIPTTAYKTYSFEFRTPAAFDTNQKLIVNFSAEKYDTVTIPNVTFAMYLDDVGLYEVLPTDNLITNGDFNTPTGKMDDVALINSTYPEVYTVTNRLTNRLETTANYAARHQWYRATGGAVNATTDAYSGICVDSNGNYFATAGQTLIQAVRMTQSQQYKLTYKFMMDSKPVAPTISPFPCIDISYSDIATGTKISGFSNVSASMSYVDAQNHTVCDGSVLSTSTNASDIYVRIDRDQLAGKWVTYDVYFTYTGTTNPAELGFGYNGFVNTRTSTEAQGRMNYYVDDAGLYNVTSLQDSALVTNGDFSQGTRGWTGNIVVMNDNDGSGNYARITNTSGNGTTAGSSNVYSTISIPLTKENTTYMVSCYIRIPATSGNWLYASPSTYRSPQISLFEPMAAQRTGSPTASYSEGQNDYAYTYQGGSQNPRRVNFVSTYNVGAATGFSTGNAGGGSSNIGRDVTGQKGLPATSEGVYPSTTWTKVTWTFNTIAGTDFMGNTLTGAANVALNLRAASLTAGAMFDIKDIQVGEVGTTTASVEKTGGTTYGGFMDTSYAQSIFVGSKYTLNATAYAGYTFDGWYSGSTKVSSSPSYTYTAATTNNFTAKFIKTVGNSMYDAGFESYANNYSFYNSTTKTGDWSVYTDTGALNAWGAVTASTDIAHSGKQSVKSTEYFQNQRIPVTLKPNTTYNISYWYAYKATSDYVSSIEYGFWDPALATQTTYQARNVGGLGITSKSFTSSTIAQNTWYQQTFTITTTSKTDWLFGYKYSRSGSDNNCVFYLDDLTVVEVPQMTATIDCTDGTAGGYITAGAMTSGVTNGQQVTLTAAPYAGYTFDGWYLNNLKVSSTASYSATSDGTSQAYVAKFINSNGNVFNDYSFENYATNYKIWDGTPYNTNTTTYTGDANGWIVRNSADSILGGTWANADIRTTYAHSGTKAARFTGIWQNNYIALAPMQANTAYTVSFWYYAEPDVAQLDMVGIYNKDTSTCNSLTAVMETKPDASATVLGTWTKYTAYFYSGSGTNYQFAFKFHQSGGTAATQGFWIDDLSISKGTPTAPTSVGCAIRTYGKQGLRFKTRIDKNLTAMNVNFDGLKVIEYGTIAIKSAYLGSDELVLDGTYSGKTVAKGVAYSVALNKDIKFAETDTTVDYTAVLTGISEANYTADYAARAYMIYQDRLGNTFTVYGDTQQKAVFNIAGLAYGAQSAGSYVELQPVRQYLFDNILYKIDPTNYPAFIPN